MPASLYDNLQSFRDFPGVLDGNNYVRLPGDWSVLISYIPEASNAIAMGCYRDVNAIGAACVTAVKNALGKTFATMLPFVINGDGATIVVPPEYKSVCESVLFELSLFVDRNFEIDLRFGSILIQELEDDLVRVDVARYEIVSQMTVAVFRGGGLAMAAKRVTEQDASLPLRSSITAPLEKKLSLHTLSCRWEPVMNKKGCIMTILIYENPEAPGTIYKEVMREIDSILNVNNELNGARSAGNPVYVEHLRCRKLFETLRAHRRFHGSAWEPAYIAHALQIIWFVIIFRLGILNRFLGQVHACKEAIRSHADFRRFDDLLRMVIDCSTGQARAIENLLKEKHNHGRHLFYGVAYSSYSLLTCLTDEPKDGHHLHFVDGADGGYAIAGAMLKKQLKELKKKKRKTFFSLHKPVLDTIISDDERSIDQYSVSSEANVQVSAEVRQLESIQESFANLVEHQAQERSSPKTLVESPPIMEGSVNAHETHEYSPSPDKGEPPGAGDTQQQALEDFSSSRGYDDGDDSANFGSSQDTIDAGLRRDLKKSSKKKKHKKSKKSSCDESRCFPPSNNEAIDESRTLEEEVAQMIADLIAGNAKTRPDAETKLKRESSQKKKKKKKKSKHHRRRQEMDAQLELVDLELGHGASANRKL